MSKVALDIHNSIIGILKQPINKQLYNDIKKLCIECLNAEYVLCTNCNGDKGFVYDNRNTDFNKRVDKIETFNKCVVCNGKGYLKIK